jgi:hypothetical protein
MSVATKKPLTLKDYAYGVMIFLGLIGMLLGGGPWE